MLNSVSKQVPSDSIAKAVFYLVKEVGLSHHEIFGRTEYVNVCEEVEREGVVGGFVDRFVGKRQVSKTEKVETPGMSLTAFASYVDLFEEHQEEQEKERKKQRMRQKFKQGTI